MLKNPGQPDSIKYQLSKEIGHIQRRQNIVDSLLSIMLLIKSSMIDNKINLEQILQPRKI